MRRSKAFSIICLRSYKNTKGNKNSPFPPLNKSQAKSGAVWYTPEIPAPEAEAGGWRVRIKASLPYTVNSHLPT